MDEIEQYKTYDYPAAPGHDADMVMKGGITSGVVYPLAVCELAKQYRFRSVGGSSAGGIAAAFAAAAEYRRSVAPERSIEGFRALAGLPELLGETLAKLFQPSAGTRAAFAAFVAASDGSVPGRTRVRRVAGGVVRAHPRATALGAALVVLLVGWASIVAAGAPHDLPDWLWLVAAQVPALPLTGAVALAFAFGALARGAARGVTDNGYGLCIGSGEPTGDTKPFTDWMHERLNAVAGRPAGRPLTFGDLWGPAAVTRYRDAFKDDKKATFGDALRAAEPEVRLEMMTTNVTFCRPARMPFDRDVYLFCEKELCRWFPADVMAALKARPIEDEDGCCPDHRVPLHRLPEPPDLPVVVAVRLTLSFPALISPVPLFMRDYGDGEGTLVRCHFSDGGISSNFPIHFFDSLWPSRPTFGISLAPGHPARKPTPYYLPDPSRRRVPRLRDTSTLGGFAGAIADTVQNWSDEGQSMLPGYSDRIVEVHLDADEGGLNLGMSRKKVLALALRGAGAGRELRRFDFERHRWTRYRTAMAELQRALTKMAERYDMPDGYRALVKKHRGDGDWRAAYVPATDWLMTFAGRTAPPAPMPRVDFGTTAPRPRPDLRVTPRF